MFPQPKGAIKANPGFAKRSVISQPRAIGTGRGAGQSIDNRLMFELKNPSFSSTTRLIALLVWREKPTSCPNPRGVFSPALSRFQRMLEAAAISSTASPGRSAPPPSSGMGVFGFPVESPERATVLVQKDSFVYCLLPTQFFLHPLSVGPTLSAPQPLARFPCCSGSSCPQCHGVPLYPLFALNLLFTICRSSQG